MSPPDTTNGLVGVRIAADQVEVRRAKSKARARIFGGEPEPTRIGRFVILDRLGSGGMGLVYAAYDPQLDRRVALKLVRSDASLAVDGSARLVEEARSMAKLSHPNVITVYEAGTVDEQVFIAMELVEGYTLRSWLDAQPRKVAEILRVMRSAGAGLFAAHSAGLVHRDFKPENVLVSKDDEVSVTDFGLARTFDAADDSGARIRGAGSVATTRLAGTPAYMAPEQLHQGSVDARCDQFAWCVTIYEALTGERPFDATVLERMMTDPRFVPPPATLPVGISLPRRARMAIERGLLLDPQARFASLGELLQHLRARPRWWLPAGGGVALLAIGVGVGVGTATNVDPCPKEPQRLREAWGQPVQAEARASFEATGMPYAGEAWNTVDTLTDAYAEQWVELQQQACHSETSASMGCLQRRRSQLAATTRLLASADAAVVERSVSMVLGLPSLAHCTDPERAALEAVAATPSSAAAQSAVDEAEAHWRAGRFDDAMRSVEVAISRAQSADVGEPWFAARRLEGRIWLAQGDSGRAMEAFEAVLARADERVGTRWVADASVGLVEAQGVVGSDFEEALVLARAAEIAVAGAGNPPLIRAALQSAYARVLYVAGRPDEGLRRVREALQALERLGSHARPELGDALQLHATLLYQKGRLDEAEELLERAIEVRRELLGAEHPAFAQSKVLQGALLLARGDAAGARAAFEAAARIQRRALGLQHQAYGRTLANLGNALRVGGQLESARVQVEAALSILETSLGSTDARVIAVRSNLASLQHELGDAQAAEGAYRELIAAQRAVLGERHPQLAVGLANLGRLLLEQRRAPEARLVVEESLAIRAEVLGAEHERTLSAQITLAEVDLEEGHLEAATTAVSDVLAQRTAALGEDHPLVVEAIVLQAKIELRARRYPAAVRLAEDVLARRVRAGASAREVDGGRFLLAQASAGAGDEARARREATAIALEGPLPPELRGWCESDCRDELAALRAPSVATD